MPRPKGAPKTGGRQTGTPNRRTGILVEEFHSLGFHAAAAELVKLIPTLESETQARTLLAIMGFLYSKMTAPGVGFDEQAVLWLHRYAKIHLLVRNKLGLQAAPNARAKNLQN